MLAIPKAMPGAQRLQARSVVPLLLGLICALAMPCARAQSSGPQQVAEQDLDQIEWWKKTNYYHIYLRSFRDSNGDGNGDLRGVIEKLDYLQQIGVETVLMAPFYSSPMRDCGYDIDDYLAINPMFGTMQDFDDLVRELKGRQMRLVVDFVPNHSSDKHHWFQCSERALLEPERCGKYKDYYVWSSERRFEGRLPSNWVSVFGGGPAWSWSEIRKQFYLHQFLPQQPDLNFRNPAVRDEFKAIARFWLAKGADGLRVDSAIFLLEEDEHFSDEPPNADWRPGDDPADRLLHLHTRCLHESAQIIGDWRAVAQEAQFAGQQKVIITEAYDKIAKLIEYYGESPERRFADLPFNFELLKLNQLNFEDARQIEQLTRNWIEPTRALAWPNEHGAMAPWIIWVTGNHDNSRLLNKISRAHLSAFKFLVHLLPGVPVNYYGDELALEDAPFNEIPARTIAEGEPTRLPFRVPMAWSRARPWAGFSEASEIWMPLNRDHEEKNVETLLADRSDGQNDLKFFIELLRVRKERLNLLTFGDMIYYKQKADDEQAKQRRQILAMARVHAKFGNLLLLANLNKEQQVVVNLSSSNGTKSLIFGAPVGQPPAQGSLVMASRLEGQARQRGASLRLEGLVLEPAQSILIEY